MLLVETTRNTLINLDSWLLILGAVLPIVTAILTKHRTSDTVKGFLSIVLAGVVVLVKKGLDDGDLTWSVFINGFIQVAIPAMLSFWFLPGIPVKVNQATGDFGITPNGGPFADVPPAVPTPPPSGDTAVHGE